MTLGQLEVSYDTQFEIWRRGKGRRRGKREGEEKREVEEKREGEEKRYVHRSS